MANSLTGDFDAVLQVSGATLNRLLASMHQNAGVKANLPSFPHSIWIRLGDGAPLDGVSGYLQAQISVPSIELINGATDRFIVQFGIRGWYKTDPGAAPLPAFINGTVRAEYYLQDIDPKCPGWANRAADYLWIRVDPESVQFQGTAVDDVNPLAVIPPPPSPAATAAIQHEIARQIAGLLATRFEPAPHPVSQRFRKGSMISLSSAAGTATALPLGLDGDPSGQITSISNVLTNGSDFAIAIQRDQILALSAPTLAAIQSYSVTVKVHVSMPWPAPDIDTVYNVSINPPTIDWLPYGSFAALRIKASGSATTNSILADANFDVTQDINLTFDAGSESLSLSPGARTVTTHSSGLGSGPIADGVNGAVDGAVKSMVASACANAQPSLDAMTSRKQELIDQLRTIDDEADAHFNSASFVDDGMILRGAISLAIRQAPAVSFEKTLQEDGFSALNSWIPGGRIDRFDWSWQFSGQTKGGTANYTDRFVLRRPAGAVGRWGLRGTSQPIPGIDGAGSVCLKIEGVQVDPASGASIRVTSTTHCSRFGLFIPLTVVAGSALRPLSRELPPQPGKPRPEQSLAVDPGSTQPASNTLVLYLDGSWDQEAALTLRGALEVSQRRDAGVTLLVLFREGTLEEADGQRAVAEVEGLGRALGIATIVNEDVQGTWATILAVVHGSGQKAWRLVAPGGGVTWMHQGQIAAQQLATALNHYLISGPAPKPQSLHPINDVRTQVSPTALIPELPIQQPHCPPITLNRVGPAGSLVAFVRDASPASEAHLRTLSAQYGSRASGAPLVIAVVDGAGTDDVQRMKERLGLDFAVMPDASGTLTDRFGVRVWPTTLTLDDVGTVASVDVGMQESLPHIEPDSGPSSQVGEKSSD